MSRSTRCVSLEDLLAGRLALSSLTRAQQRQAFFLVPEMSRYVPQNPMGKPLLDIACEIPVTTIQPPNLGYFGPGGLYQYHLVLVRSGSTGQ